jgi:hypothetical protein
MATSHSFLCASNSINDTQWKKFVTPSIYSLDVENKQDLIYHNIFQTT